MRNNSSLLQLKALTIVNASHRNTSLDVFRGIAILLVVLFHFNKVIPVGYIGVDLFFVISGTLVSMALIKQVERKEKINFFKFFLQRGFKIWPSYFIFLFLGIPLAKILYSTLQPQEIIQPWELKKYLFFYKNYSFQPVHSVFDQVWSLCVEEHFYILLPLGFIVLMYFNAGKASIFASVIGAILFGIVAKIVSRHSGSFGTHAYIDALSWGVLLSLLLTHYSQIIKNIRYPYLLSVAGLALATFLLYQKSYNNTFFYERVVFHSLLPFSFFLMIIGSYHYDFRKLFILRFVAYYSYNWYLWHAMFIIIFIKHFGAGPLALLSYLIFSFLVAVLFTVLIEEQFLKLRDKVIARIFGAKPEELIITAKVSNVV